MSSMQDGMNQDEALVDYEADEEEEEEEYNNESEENENDPNLKELFDESPLPKDKEDEKLSSKDDNDKRSDEDTKNKESEGKDTSNDETHTNAKERMQSTSKRKVDDSHHGENNHRGFDIDNKDSSANNSIKRARPSNDDHDQPFDSAPRQSTSSTSTPTVTATKPMSTLESSSSAHGVYMPPFRRRQLLKQQEEAEAEELQASTKSNTTKEDGEVKTVQILVPVHTQRRKWEELKKAINGTINRLNTSTIKELIHSLFQNANLIRGKGLLTKSILRAATTSPSYAPVYASLIAVVNTKLPEIGELVLSRSILTFRKSYSRQDRALTMSITNFIGCLFNQGICHELLCLQLLTVLLDGDPTDDSVEVAVQLTKVVGMALAESSPAGIHAVMERFRNLLHDGSIGRRVQYKIEELIKVRKSRFKDYPALVEGLDLVEREEQIMFEIGLDDEELKKEDGLDVFRFDHEFVENENDWVAIQKEILGEDSDDDSDGSGSGSGESDTDDSDDGDDSDDEDNEDGVLQQVSTAPQSGTTSTEMVIHDMTEKDLVNLRRKIYLTIMSSATFEECAHKLSKLSIPPGREMELINMIIECCSQERTFLRYYGLIASRFCLLDQRWNEAFLSAFEAQYSTIHRLETNKLRNVAKLFAHLLHTDSLPWSCISVIHLNEDETTSSSRIFLKILVQEMAEAIGIGGLVKRFETDDPEVMEWYKEMFPKDNPRKTRYAINFFTSIGLGPLTDGLREHLKNAPKLIMMQAEAEAEAKRLAIENASSDDSSSVSSSSSSSISSSSSGSSSSSSSYTSTSSSSYTSSSSDESSVSSRRRRRGGGRDRGRKNRSDNRPRKSEKRDRRDRSVSHSRPTSTSAKKKPKDDGNTKTKSSRLSRSRSRSNDSGSRRREQKSKGSSRRNRRKRSESTVSSNGSKDNRKSKR